MGYNLKKEFFLDMEVELAYNDNGDYVGDKAFAKRVYDLGVEPELIDSSRNVCSIGFCDKEQKWYGWSHRAMYGFGIGSEVKRGDLAYAPTDKDDFLEDMNRFWSDEHKHTVSSEHSPKGVKTSWIYDDTVPNEKLRSMISGVMTNYPDEYGNGEWTAKTLDDAKQMAIDFAKNVS